LLEFVSEGKVSFLPLNTL